VNEVQLINKTDVGFKWLSSNFKMLRRLNN
jgi:hypothetical protein